MRQWLSQLRRMQDRALCLCLSISLFFSLFIVQWEVSPVLRLAMGLQVTGWRAGVNPGWKWQKEDHPHSTVWCCGCGGGGGRGEEREVRRHVTHHQKSCFIMLTWQASRRQTPRVNAIDRISVRFVVIHSCPLQHIRASLFKKVI